jgi:hypothetical protein
LTYRHNAHNLEITEIAFGYDEGYGATRTGPHPCATALPLSLEELRKQRLEGWPRVKSGLHGSRRRYRAS